MDDNNKLARREREPLATLESAPAGRYVGAAAFNGGEPHLRDYLLILRKHLWLIVSVVLAVVTVVAIASFKARPVFEAVARVEIDMDNTNILPFQSASSYDFYWDVEMFIETRAKVLRSETLALLTIRSLDLERSPEFAGPPDKSRARAASTTETENSNAGPSAILGDFLGRLSVSRIRNTRLVEVKFEAHDPDLAARVVNAHIANFIEQNYRSRYESTIQASDWLADQLDDLKVKVETSEDALVRYERENRIWAIDERQNITTQKLSDINTELTRAQGERFSKESNYQLVRAGNLDALPAVRDSHVIQGLLTREADFRTQHAEALNRFGPNYPAVQRLEAQIQEVDALLNQEKQNIAARIESEYKAARERERLLAQALEGQKAEAATLAEKLVQYNILKREAQTNKQVYDGLLQRLKEASISAGLRSSGIRVVDPALVPSDPARPRKTRNLLMALVVGLIGGVGLAFLQEYLDNTVKTPDDVEQLSQLPSLVVVPEFGPADGRGALPRLLKSAAAPAVGESAVAMMAHEHPRSHIAEVFRSLRTSILLSQPDHPPQLILVTSALPLEGKTTAAMNLAVTLAQLGDRTLLIDSDLRKPGVAKTLALNQDKQVGLSSYLAGVASLEKATLVHPAIPNLAVIPAGPIPPNPAELLSGKRLQEAFALLRQDYRFIILDSPPVLAATDAVILSVQTDGVLLLARSGKTSKEAFLRARDLLASVKCRLLGVVLNAVDFTSPAYYYSYKYYPYPYGQDKDASA